MPRRHKDLGFEESFFNNMEDYNVIKGRLFDLACGCFGFENLPQNIDVPYVVKTMINQGKILFFKDEILPKENGYFMYSFVNNGGLDPYGRPIQRRVTLKNIGATYELDRSNSVIIYTNVSGTSLLRIIEYFARNIYLINRTIQINVNAQKTPVILTCSENERLSYENLLKQYEGNVPFIFGSKDLDFNKLNAINLNAPFVSDRLYQLMANYWNEFLTFFGIPNISNNKKERLITDEVQRTMGGILVAKRNFESQIQRGFDEVNDMFGLDIKFTWGVPEEDEKQIDNNTEEEYNDNERGVE